MGMSTPNAAGQQVDLLNTVDEPAMDVDDGDDSGSSADEYPMNTPDTNKSAFPANIRNMLSNTPLKYRERLKTIREQEQDPSIRARKDELRIQEQALDFLRNLISESRGSAYQMIDYILEMIGRNRFFEIMVNKLTPEPVPLSSMNKTQSSQPPQPEIILATLFVLIHIANGKPQHRLLLINQPALLPPLHALFNHQDRRIRVALVWLINNLTWMDDANDLIGARQRALELRKHGFEEGVKRLLQDSDLDTRERAKTGIEQISKLLEGYPGGIPASITGGRGPSGNHSLMDRSHRGWER
jgi:armadillo repeat-containing protein 8